MYQLLRTFAYLPGSGLTARPLLSPYDLALMAHGERLVRVGAIRSVSIHPTYNYVQFLDNHLRLATASTFGDFPRHQDVPLPPAAYRPEHEEF